MAPPKTTVQLYFTAFQTVDMIPKMLFFLRHRTYTQSNAVRRTSALLFLFYLLATQRWISGIFSTTLGLLGGMAFID